jgi:hypothetical protein
MLYARQASLSCGGGNPAHSKMSWRRGSALLLARDLEALRSRAVLQPVPSVHVSEWIAAAV